MPDVISLKALAEILTQHGRLAPWGKSLNGKEAARRFVKSRRWTRDSKGRLLVELIPDEKIRGAARARLQPDRELREREALSFEFEKCPNGIKREAYERAEILDQVVRLLNRGERTADAVRAVARESGRGARTLWRYLQCVKAWPRPDWPAKLCPAWVGGRKRQQIPEVLQLLFVHRFEDYSRRPIFSKCYELMRRDVERDPLLRLELGANCPSLKVFRRWWRSSRSRGEQILARFGPERHERWAPTVIRDRSHLHALWGVCGDGHRCDFRVAFEDGEINRPVAVVWADLFSNKILAWRIAKTENAEAVRHAFAHICRSIGIPTKAWFDNGRAFNAKQLTGQAAFNRHRFRSLPGDPIGTFALLGVELHATRLYSGRSKPIERAFKELEEILRCDPELTGAYVGNDAVDKPEGSGRHISFDLFRQKFREAVLFYNSRDGSRTRVAHGRSFDSVFEESIKNHPITVATEAQLRRCILPAKRVRLSDRDDTFEIAGTRYHANVAGLARKVATVYYDPENLTAPAFVYSIDGRFVGEARPVTLTKFDSIDDYREHERAKRQVLRAERQAHKARTVRASLEAKAAQARIAESLREECVNDSRTRPKVVRLLQPPIDLNAARNERAAKEITSLVESLRSKEG